MLKREIKEGGSGKLPNTALRAFSKKSRTERPYLIKIIWRID